VEGPGFPLSWAGAVDVQANPNAVVVRSSGEHEVHALGLKLRMDSEETAIFEGNPPAAPMPPDPKTQPVKKP